MVPTKAFFAAKLQKSAYKISAKLQECSYDSSVFQGCQMKDIVSIGNLTLAYSRREIFRYARLGSLSQLRPKAKKPKKNSVSLLKLGAFEHEKLNSVVYAIARATNGTIFLYFLDSSPNGPKGKTSYTIRLDFSEDDFLHSEAFYHEGSDTSFLFILLGSGVRVYRAVLADAFSFRRDRSAEGIFEKKSG